LQWFKPTCDCHDEKRNSADCESLVPSFGAFVAFRHVGREPTGEGQHLAWFAGNVRAEIPGVGTREESRVGKGMHFRAPLFFRGGRCLEPLPIALSNVVQQSSDPVALKLCASRPVGECVRALRTVNEEKIRKARRGHSYRGCPFLNLMTEFPDQDHPGRVVARGNKQEMRARLATIVAKLGTADPDRVASQLALIINGAYATGLFAEPADLRDDLVDAAHKLLAPSLPGRAIAGRGKDTGKPSVRRRE
jgi:hypothetical protein